MVIYEAMTPQCGISLVQILVVRVDIGVVIYEAMTPQCGRSVVQVLVVRVDIGVVIYEAMTPQCGRSVVQVLVVRIGYRSGDLCSYDTAVWVVTVSVAVQSDIGVVSYEAMTLKWGTSVVLVLVFRVKRIPIWTYMELQTIFVMFSIMIKIICPYLCPLSTSTP